MSYKAANNSRIGNAFSKALTSVKRQSLNAISAGTKAGRDYALELHEKHKHYLHLILGGDFGYGVEQDGATKEFDVVAGKVSVKRTAESAIERHLANGPKKGALGVVSAGMESAHFHENYELGVLTSSFRHAKEVALDAFDK